jgi:hypothetical protein
VEPATKEDREDEAFDFAVRDYLAKNVFPLLEVSKSSESRVASHE